VTYIDDVFGPTGLLAKKFERYLPRPVQLKMVHAVHESIANHEPYVIEAGCGVGKSFGYLIPSIYHVTQASEKKALLSHRNDVDTEDPTYHGGRGEDAPRVLVVTANISLQDQLTRKDLPFLQKLLPWPFKFQIAKGRSNFICLDRVANTDILELNDRADEDQWLEIVAWSKATAAGDFSELPFDVRPRLKRHTSVSAEECHGVACRYHNECFAMKARENAGQAEVVVTNYHLFFAHLAASKDGGSTSLLPTYDILIMDEAHAMEEIARAFFGFRISAHSLKEPLRLLGGRHPLRKIVENEVDKFFMAMSEYRHSSAYKARLKEPALFHHEPLMGTLETFAKTLLDEANKLGGNVEEGERMLDGATKREQNDLRKAAARLKEAAENIDKAVLLIDPERTVYHLNLDMSGSFGERLWLCGEPIEPSGLLRSMIWSAPDPKPVAAPEVAPGIPSTSPPVLPPKRKLPVAIATSATLSTKADGSEKSIGYQASRMGAHDAKRLVVGSPFDLERTVLTVFPRDSPDPKSPNYGAELAPLIVECVRQAEGRTLGLFTSRKVLDIATAAVREAFHGKYKVLKQYEKPRTILVEEFRKDTSSILFGTKSFWAGVDVPGESLSCVLIDKIPFDPPDDPVLDALSERDKDTFKNRSIPRAAIDLRQAFGRLVRSETDRGAVVLFDRRLFSTGWGKILVKALPCTKVTADIADIGPFIRQEKKT
jgi:ATP-dependent DNA helicase DinG